MNVRFATSLVAVAAAYFGAAKVGLELSVAHGVITPVWAPTGIALAVLVLFGRRLWPAVALGAFVANAASGASLPEAAAISVGNTLEAVVGATLLGLVGFRPALDRVRDVLALIGLAALAATTLSATNGVTTLWISGDVPGSSYGSDWLLWWIGDAMGALIVAPLLMVWFTTPPRLDRARTVEGLLLLMLLVGLSTLVFLGGLWRYPHLVFPVLVWATLRFQQLGSVTGNFLVAGIAVAGAVTGETPIGSSSPTVVVQILEGLLAGVSVAMLILGAVLAERASTERKLERAHAALAEAQEVARIGSWEWTIASNRIGWSDELYRLYGLAPRSIEVTLRVLPRVGSSRRPHCGRTRCRTRAVKPAAVRPRPPDRPADGRGSLVPRPRPGDRRRDGRAGANGRNISGRHAAQARRRGTRQHSLSRLARAAHAAHVDPRLRDHASREGELLTEEDRSEMVAYLVQQATRLDRLLSDLLDIDRLRHGLIGPSLQPTDVGRLAETVVADHDADGHPIEVRAGTVVADVDAAKVERILENLIANAVKYTPEGTEIRVRVESVDDGVLLAVDDRGPGVPESDREAIFGIFNRGMEAAAQGPGAGIGLSLAARFVALHDGRIWVEDNPGGGASFRVVLPSRRAA